MDIKKIDQNMEDSQTILSKDAWYNLNNPALRGMLFYDENSSSFDRLKKGVTINEKVDHLRYCPAGINISFQTNSSYLKIRAKVKGTSYMSHMTAVATLGFDLYYKNKNQYVFLKTTKINQASYEITLIQDLSIKMKEFRLYFPLYIVLEEVFLGIEVNSCLDFIKQETPKIVVYGTSITQGGCATRPGMNYVSIMDRHLPYEMINLGFSGSCHLEEKIAHLINQVPKKYLIIEAEANSYNPEQFHIKIKQFLNIITNCQVIVISHFPEAQTLLFADLKKERQKYLEIQKELPNVLCLDGQKLLKKLQFEETVDGIHLTDLGFYTLGQKLVKLIKDLDRKENGFLHNRF